MDLCKADSTKCYMEEYAELTWSEWEQDLAATDLSEDVFEAAWATKVSKRFDLPENDIKMLWTKQDTHDSNWRVREFWKYGASIGVSGTPSVFINGVQIADFPADEQAWIDLIGTLLPT